MFCPLELDSEEMVYFSHEVYVCKEGKFLLEVFFRGLVATEVNEVINEKSKVVLIFFRRFSRGRDRG